MGTWDVCKADDLQYRQAATLCSLQRMVDMVSTYALVFNLTVNHGTAGFFITVAPLPLRPKSF